MHPTPVAPRKGNSRPESQSEAAEFHSSMVSNVKRAYGQFKVEPAIIPNGDGDDDADLDLG
jgi:hypothetical protein